MALKPLRKAPALKAKVPPRFKPPGRPIKPPTFRPKTTPRPTAAAPRSTTAGLTPYTGYEGPGVQDFINQGTIQWDQGLGDIGYTPPPTPSYGGGGDTDYGALIGGDWEVQDAEAAHASQMARARGDFQAGLRQHLIDLGISDTSKLGNLGQYIDNETIQKAVENKYSANAQITQGAERSRAGNNAALAARGLLSSGQTTKTQQDVSAQAESQRYGALREFLEGGAAGLGGLADMEYQGARGIAQARQAAAMRAAEFAQYGTEPVGGEAQTSQASAARAAMLGKQAWLRKHPRGKYANYVRAYKRHTAQGY